MKKCITCAKPFAEKREGQINCSRSCNATYRNKEAGKRFVCPRCLICGKETRRLSGMKYCSVKCQGIGRRGDKHPLWKGGIQKKYDGYLYEYAPDHPFKDSENRVLQHRRVMERSIGRFLRQGEVVHHVNADKKDNRIENLLLLENQAEHLAVHGFLKRFRKLKTIVLNKSEELLETPSGQSAA